MDAAERAASSQVTGQRYLVKADMPYARCPVCRTLFHLYVSDRAAWYREHFPDLPIGSEVPVHCFEHWKERETEQGRTSGDDNATNKGTRTPRRDPPRTG